MSAQPETATCTDCGKRVTWLPELDGWFHDDGSSAYGMDGHIVHLDKLPEGRP